MSGIKAPLAAAVAAYINEGRLRGHMPGHKGHSSANGLFACWGELAAWDVTEAEGLDDLHAPAGAIAEAEALLAAAVGAGQAHFLVNGASVGILASVLAACGKLRAERQSLKAEDIRVVLPRNAHRSAWNAVALAGCTPVWLPVQMMRIEETGLALGVTLKQLELALQIEQNVAAALFVYPNYYGVCVELRAMLAACREKGVLSVVDEAHGSQLAFVEPERSAVRLGGDLVVNSWHKSMGSLGQTAVLLASLNNKRGLAANLRLPQWLGMLQTTSPSYPLLASLDAARAEWCLYGESRAAALRQNRERLREITGGLKLLQLFEEAMLPAGFGNFRYDESKGLLFSRAGHSGWQIAAALRQAGIEPELADQRFALLLLSYADDLADTGWRRALQLADELLQQVPAAEIAGRCFDFGLPEQVMPPGEALPRQAVYLPLAEAAGRIGAGLLTPYPPGIPWVGPGERINSEIVEGLLAVLAAGGRIQGLHGDSNDEPLVAVLA